MPWRNFKRFFVKLFRQPFYALQVLSRRVKAYGSYLLGRGRSSVPEAITLFLTHRCNLRCKMCGQWGESGVTKQKASDAVAAELPFSLMQKLFDDVSAFAPNITLFGGEPLLYPQCIELIEYIKQKKMHCLMITNGAMLGVFAEKLVDAGLDELNVSLDGGRELHDTIRGMPGLYDKITAGLKRVNEYKKKDNRKKPFINLQCTVTKYNYEHLEQLTKVARDVGADSLTYHNLIFLDKGLLEKQKLFDAQLGSSSCDWEGFVFSPEIDPEKLYAKMQGILSQAYPFSVDFYPNLTLKGLKEYYNNPSYLPAEYPSRCLSPWIVAYVFPDGGVRPCLNSTYSFGNIHSAGFPAVWNGAEAISFRKTLKKNGIFPVCVRCTELYRY